MLRVDVFQVGVVVWVEWAIFARPSCVVFVMQGIQYTEDVVVDLRKSRAHVTFPTYVRVEVAPSDCPFSCKISKKNRRDGHLHIVVDE